MPTAQPRTPAISWSVEPLVVAVTPPLTSTISTAPALRTKEPSSPCASQPSAPTTQAGAAAGVSSQTMSAAHPAAGSRWPGPAGGERRPLLACLDQPHGIANTYLQRSQYPEGDRHGTAVHCYPLTPRPTRLQRRAPRLCFRRTATEPRWRGPIGPPHRLGIPASRASIPQTDPFPETGRLTLVVSKGR